MKSKSNPGRKRVVREGHRIPYNVWSTSQLSVAKYYGGIEINGKMYEIDYANAPKKKVDGEMRYFPDLVEVLPTPSKKVKPAK